MGNLNVQDLRRGTLYRDILSLKSRDNPQIGRFEWWSYNLEAMQPDDFPLRRSYGKKLRFHMDSIRVVYFQPFLSEIMHYIMHSMVEVLLEPEVW